MSLLSTPVNQTPDQVLQMALQGQVPEIKPYEALAELNKRVKAKQMQQAQSGVQAIQQAQQMQQQPNIAQQLVQQNQALSGVASLPNNQTYAGGGIVAFADGGSTNKSFLGLNFDYIDMQKYGIYMSPYDAPEVRLAKIAKYRELKKQIEEAPEIPKGTWLPSERNLPQLQAPALNPPPMAYLPIPDVVSQAQAQPQPQMPPQAAAAPQRPRAPSAAPPQVPNLKAPAFNLTPVQYEVPKELTLDDIIGEQSKLTGSRMSAYDERMRKFMERAQAMERGEGIRQPQMLSRAVDALGSGAIDEIDMARRAGVRPSLGAALGRAGREARKADAALQDRIERMKEKGLETQMLLEKARIAYESGQQDLAQRYFAEARKSQAEAIAMRNKNKEAIQAVEAAKSTREFDEYKLQRESAEKAAEREKDLQVARISANARVAGGGGGGVLSPARIAAIRQRAAADVDKDLQKDMNYLRLRDPVQREQYKQKAIELRYRTILAQEGIEVPGAAPAAATQAPALRFNPATGRVE